MARFPEEWLSELIEKNDIVDVISQYVPLKRQGSRYWAKCPWHSERTASFSVVPSKQMYYCFSCKKGGGVINFVMEYERLTYTEAVERLAERAGMELPQNRFSAAEEKREREKREYKKRLYELMRFAALMYHECLRSPEGRAAREYLADRGVLSVASRFGLGYAPDSFRMAVDKLKKQGYTRQELIDAGLVREKGGRIYDTFRGRVMFPVQDVRGNVVAFGARIIGQGEPKYLNSPETVIFNKRDNLYALNMVKKRPGLSEIVLVEGYMDVVSIAAAGFDTAVAALGTAFTSGQARLLKRFVSSVAVMLDSDRAGISAADRACSILEKERIEARVVLLDNGMDPDEYVRKYGLESLQKKIREGITPTELRLRLLKSGYDMQSEQDRVRYSTKACELIGALENEIEKQRYLSKVSRETGIGVSTLSNEMSRTSGNNSLPGVVKFKSSTDDEINLLAAIVEKPSLIEKLGIIESDFSQEKVKNIFSDIMAQINKGKMPTNGEIINMLPDGDVLKAELASANTERSAEDYAFNMLINVRKNRLEREKQALLSRFMETKDVQYMEKVKKINEQISDIGRQKAEKLKY